MKNQKEEVAIRIEALDPSGIVVPIHMGPKGIEPGPNPEVVAANTTLDINLINKVGVDPVNCEIVVLAFHDVVDHALVTWNGSFVSQQNNLSGHEIPENPIRALRLPIPGTSVTLFARTQIPGLTLTHPQIAGYRFTRENPAGVHSK